MSLLTLQLGQCGNQVGGQIFSTLIDDIFAKSTGLNSKENQAYMQGSLDTFFTEHETSGRDGSLSLPVARAVLVDMESKAITHTLQMAKKSGKWIYPEKRFYHQKRGSGNNWAHGFCIHGPKSHDDIMNLIRKEVEKCDRLGGFLNLMSLAGGTGSGVGAYVTQSLRDTYPHSFITNQVGIKTCSRVSNNETVSFRAIIKEFILISLPRITPKVSRVYFLMKHHQIKQAQCRAAVDRSCPKT